VPGWGRVLLQGRDDRASPALAWLASYGHESYRGYRAVWHCAHGRWEGGGRWYGSFPALLLLSLLCGRRGPSCHRLVLVFPRCPLGCLGGLFGCHLGCLGSPHGYFELVRVEYGYLVRCCRSRCLNCGFTQGVHLEAVVKESEVQVAVLGVVAVAVLPEFVLDAHTYPSGIVVWSGEHACSRPLCSPGSQARCQYAAECAVEVIAVIVRFPAFVVEVVFGV
jgi:hypothetical protein